MIFDFPEPYGLEVPRRIGEARKQLSPEGEEVLESLLAQEGVPEDIIAAMKQLPTSEQRALLGINNLLGDYPLTARTFLLQYVYEKVHDSPFQCGFPRRQCLSGFHPGYDLPGRYRVPDVRTGHQAPPA